MPRNPLKNIYHSTLMALICSLPVHAAHLPIQIACVGDSTTFGMNIEKREQFSYPAQLQARLGEHVTVYNYGANGATAIRDTPDFTPYITRDVYHQSLRQDADIVILTLGANDSKKAYWNPHQYQEDLSILINEYLAITPNIILGLPAPVFNKPGHWDVNAENLTAARKIIRLLASEFQLTLVDFFNPLNSAYYFLNDGVHPNVQGAEKMASVAEQVLLAMLSNSSKDKIK